MKPLKDMLPLGVRVIDAGCEGLCGASQEVTISNAQGLQIACLSIYASTSIAEEKALAREIVKACNKGG